MKQQVLMLCGEKFLEWQTRELPPLEPDEVLLKTIAGAISIGAEMPQYNGRDITEVDPQYPRNTGYENYSEVVGVGEKVQSIQNGDKVIAFYGHKTVSIAKENGIIPVTKGISSHESLLTILSCDSAKGVLKLNPSKSDKVLVTGMGTMGLLTVYFLEYYIGVKHIDIIEPEHGRREIAKRFGAKHTFSVHNQLKSNYDYGIECSGKFDAFQVLQEGVKTDGEICILSDGNREEFKLTSAFYKKELRIVGSSDGWNYENTLSGFLNKFKKHPLLINYFNMK